MIEASRPSLRRVAVTCVALLAAALGLLLAYLNYAGQLEAGQAFDEAFYVPAARDLVAHQLPSNLQHPPLGKYLIALGMALLGDGPVGWRIASVVFGALTVVGMYLLARALVRDERAAILAAVVTLLDQVHFVMARLAMLEVFVVCFMVLALAAFAHAWDGTLPTARRRLLLCACGVLLGLGLATKWYAAVAWMLCLGLAAVAAALDELRVPISRLARAPSAPTVTDRSPLADVGAGWLVLALVVIPVSVYVSSFVPYLFLPGHPSLGPLDLLGVQLDMVRAQLATGRKEHHFESDWYTWPLMVRPIWIAWRDEPELRSGRAVVLVGNPLVLWGGLVAVAACAWTWVRERSFDALFAVLAFFACWLFWAFAPRAVGYFYYYYPAAVMLGLAWASLFARALRGPHPRTALVAMAAFVAATAALFVYFYPMIAWLSVPNAGIESRTWFSTWH